MTMLPQTSVRAIRATGLAVLRGERLLFRDLGFTIGMGEALVLTGPNGSGKTSLLAVLSGTLRPDAGSVEFEGRDPERRPGTDLHAIGYRTAIKPRLSALENLQFWARLMGGDPGLAARALDAVGLAHAADLDAGYLSAGQSRRLSLARLLVAPRPVWLLDEPTAALDTEGEALVGRLVDAHLADGGLAVIATHHDLGLAAPTVSVRLGEEA